MRDRLVVGRGRLATTMRDVLVDRSAGVIVLSDDPEYVETLRSRSLTVREGDPTDPSALAALESVDSVLAIDDDPSYNAAVLSAADSAVPAAFTLGYLGPGTDTGGAAAVRSAADRVVDPESVLSDAVVDRLGEGGARMHRLERVLSDIDGPLAVVTHDNPDPDAIASAVALDRLAETVGTDAETCYFGSISHQENRAMVNVLDLDLRNVDAETDLDQFGGFALVDHSRPGVNDQLPPDTPIDIVIDHHPPRGPVNAEYVDLRSDFGATSTLLVEYFQQFDVAIEPTVATALLFGIRIDTDNFSREVSAADFEAASTLVSVADLDTLDRFETPSIDPETMETIATAITNRTMHGPALITGVGYISNRDALAQAADRLLNLDGVTTTLVHGINEQTVFVSARARGADVDLGEALRDAFGQIGSAGGHADMAGAQLELGMMGVNEDTESVPDVVDDVLSDRFLEVLEARWNRQVPSDFFPGPIEELTPTDRS